MAIKVLFHNIRLIKLSVEDAARLVVKECSLFWEKAKIPVQQFHRAVKKLLDLYYEWKSILKSKNRDGDIYESRREEWKNGLNDLFDIAHNDALILIKVKEDKQFLINQRQKGRPGSMLGIDLQFLRKNERIKKRIEAEEARMKKHVEALPKLTGDDDIPNISDSECESIESEGKRENMSLPKNKRACKNILTPRVAAVFDKVKFSNRDAVHILVAVLEALGLNPNNYIINRTSLRHQREVLRKHISKNVVQRFKTLNQPLTIHWDTKLLNNITGKPEDRLSIIATAPNTEHILNIPDIPCGTGLEISSAVYDTLDEIGILDRTEAFVFDTTSSNTGRFKGACTLLEKRIGRDILYLGCRHHIFEIVLAAVFSEANKEIYIAGPDIVIFKKFKKIWHQIRQENYEPGINDPRLKEILGDECDEIISFANKKLLEALPRNDCKEFLELIVIFLGGTPSRGISFYKPGAFHLARWMSKCIYCLKILLFRNQFPELTKSETKSLMELAGFIIKCYASFWFDATKAHLAPLNDLKFLRKLEEYKIISRNIADKAILKIINHLYYLSEECVGFSLFDPGISVETKAKLVAKINNGIFEDLPEEMDGVPKKLSLKQGDVKSSISRDDTTILVELFSTNTKKIFNRFNICTSFLKEDPKTWESSDDYKKGKSIVEVIKDEEQRQYLFKIVQHYRQQYSKDATMKDLSIEYDS